MHSNLTLQMVEIMQGTTLYIYFVYRLRWKEQPPGTRTPWGQWGGVEGVAGGGEKEGEVVVVGVEEEEEEEAMEKASVRQYSIEWEH